MQMWKLGFARKAYTPQWLLTVNLIALVDLDATLAHMAILSMPTATVVNEDTVAALAALDPVRVILSREMVRKVIPGGCYRARGGRQDCDVAVKPTRVGKPKIRTLMAIIDKSAASIVPGTWPRISVNVVLDNTDGADFTSHRQGQPEFCFRDYFCAAHHQKNNGDTDTRDDRTPRSCC